MRQRVLSFQFAILSASLLSFGSINLSHAADLVSASVTLQQDRLGTDKAEEEAEEDDDRPIFKPIRHYVVEDSQSIELFPKDAENYLSRYVPKLEGKIDISERVNAARKKLEETREARRKKGEEEMLPCFEDKTVRRDVSVPKNMEADTPVVDYLFLEPQALPKDAARIFGGGVNIVVYDLENPKPPASDMVRSLRVPCLPFRIRGTGKYVYHHWGRDALRNFYPEDSGNSRRGGNK